MNRAAFIRDNGLINHSFLPDSQDTYTAGQVVDGLTVQFYDYDEDPAAWHNTKFWDFSLEEWADLPTNPNAPYYIWNLAAKNYTLDRASFEKDTRDERDKKLKDTDWCVLPDAPVDDTYLQAMKTYRQELRDFPATIDFDTIEDISTISWPVEPQK